MFGGALLQRLQIASANRLLGISGKVSSSPGPTIWSCDYGEPELELNRQLERSHCFRGVVYEVLWVVETSSLLRSPNPDALQTEVICHAQKLRHLILWLSCFCLIHDC